jgi:hypothetical protein
VRQKICAQLDLPVLSRATYDALSEDPQVVEATLLLSMAVQATDQGDRAGARCHFSDVIGMAQSVPSPSTSLLESQDLQRLYGSDELIARKRGVLQSDSCSQSKPRKEREGAVRLRSARGKYPAGHPLPLLPSLKELHMRHVLTLSAAVLAASLSLASAQVRSQSIVVSPLPVAVAAPALHVPAALAELVRRGGSITLQDAQGRTVATVNRDGSVTLSAGMALGNATAVSVKVGNTTVSYPLAARVNGSGQLLVTRKNPGGRTQVVPLVAAVSRATDGRDGQQSQDGKKADGKRDGQQGQDGEGDQGGQQGNSGERGNAGHPGQPGHGNGHR